MSSPAFRPSDDANRAVEEPQPKSALSLRLSEIIEQSLLQAPNDSPAQANAAEVSALRAVARRYRGQPLELQPVIDLVRAVIPADSGLAPTLPVDWETMTKSIAISLFEDAAAQQRLHSLWARLCEGDDA